jgi:hypothetical protein
MYQLELVSPCGHGKMMLAATLAAAGHHVPATSSTHLAGMLRPHAVPVPVYNEVQLSI